MKPAAIAEFEQERQRNIERMRRDGTMQDLSRAWMERSVELKYSYNFSWLGRPVIQYPQDLFAMQEIIWSLKPDLIIETGVAHGGGLIFYASMLELLGNDGCVLGIDIDIRKHNLEEIQKHPLFKRIKLIEGCSASTEVLSQVSKLAAEKETVLITLDSNHTHEHVSRELKLYSPLVSQGSYMVVFDTIVEELPDNMYPDRPWSKGNNPMTAVGEFLAENRDFEIDHELESKLLISVAPSGYLRRVRRT